MGTESVENAPPGGVGGPVAPPVTSRRVPAHARREETPVGPRARHRVIVPRRGLSLFEVRELWAYRELFWRFSRRDITLRYRQTALGVLWVVIQPLFAAGIFAFVFGKVAHFGSDGLPYIVFAMAGMLSWNAFANTINRASISVLGNASMVTKVFFPRIILPLENLTAALVDYAVGLAMFVVLCFTMHNTHGQLIGLHLQFVTFPLWLALALIMALGAGMACAALMVRYRDIQYVLPVVITFLLYLTPVAYSVSQIPKDLRWVANLNPLTGMLEGTRWALLGAGHFNLGATIYSVVTALVLLVVGGMIFEQFDRTFSDVI